MTFGVGHASPSTYLQYSVTFNETVCLAAVFKSVEEGHGIPVECLKCHCVIGESVAINSSACYSLVLKAVAVVARNLFSFSLEQNARS